MEIAHLRLSYEVQACATVRGRHFRAPMAGRSSLFHVRAAERVRRCLSSTLACPAQIGWCTLDRPYLSRIVVNLALRAGHGRSPT